MTVRRRRAQPMRWACIFAGSLAVGLVGLVGCDGGDGSAPGPGENGTPPTGPVYVGPITRGINTDQSLPAHPVRGPTASLPEGTRQIGH